MHALTRRHLLKLGLASGVLAAAANTPAKALVEIIVSGGNFVPLPIAIPDFASSDPAFGAEIAQIVRDNLKRSGLFVPLDPATLPSRTVLMPEMRVCRENITLRSGVSCVVALS